MQYLYHGSTTQNLKNLEPRKRFTPNGEIDYSAIYATPSPAFAITHSFPWSTNEGFDLSIEDGEIFFSVPSNFRERLNVQISIYKLPSEGFQQTKEESTGYTWHATKDTLVLEEVKYESVLEALEKLNVKVSFK
jgi:hypothetical protein